MSDPAHSQAAYARRFDWGPAGARALVADAGPGDVAVVVDVLSFTTTLTVALEHGIAVLPYPWAAEQVEAYAAEHGAVVATGRRQGRSDGRVSLSPASFAGVTGIARLVLPSPNGSALSFALADAGVTVVGACLRNAGAVARWVAATSGGRVSVLAAGERWPDDSLRPAVEDLWGAGAVLSALGVEGSSPEAAAAVEAFESVRQRLPELLAACASGRELVDAGFAGDVAIAAAVDVSDVVPVLDGTTYVDRGSAQDV